MKKLRKTIHILLSVLMLVAMTVPQTVTFAEDLVPGVESAAEELKTQQLEETGAGPDTAGSLETNVDISSAPEQNEPESSTELSAPAEAPSLYAETTVKAEDLTGLDFSSKRILVGTEDESIFADPSVIVASFDGIYLLQFADEETARSAYAYYLERADFVEVDAQVSIADEAYTSDAASETVMTAENNPFEDMMSTAGSVENWAYDVALIDTGSDAATAAVSVLGESGADDNGHGNAMTDLIRNRDAGIRILSVKALDTNGTGTVSSVYAAMKLAIEKHVRIINLSASMIASADSRIIEDVIAEAAGKGMIVVGAAGNQGIDAKYCVPGRSEPAVIVGACDENGQKQAASNYGETVDYNIIAGSTSEAAAQMSAILANLPAGELESIADQGGIVFHTGYVPAAAEKIPVLEGDGQFHASYNAGGSFYLEDFFGISREQFTSFLEGREAANNYNYYLNTPYGVSWAESDSFYPNGAPRWDGYTGMNCAGFVRCAVNDAGGSLAYVEKWCDRNGADAPWGLAGASVWFTFMANERVLWRSYNTKEELLADGWATKGDIIYCLPTGGGDTHIGFYWGSYPGEDKMWHSYHYNTIGGVRYGNTIGPVASKSDCIWYVFRWSPDEGYLKLHKASAKPDLTDGNDCYHLEGAVYTVYQGTEVKGTLTTDANGDTETIRLPIGEYTVIETLAPDGYDPDTTPVTATVTANHTAEAPCLLQVMDTPAYDPMAIEITKLSGSDSATQFSLAGTQFEICYYDNQSGDVSGTPVRKWTVEVKAHDKEWNIVEKEKAGEQYIYWTLLDEAYLADGSDSLYMVNGRAVLPLGTVSVREIRPATGYTLTNSVLKDSDGNEILLTDGRFIGIITKEGGVARLNYGNLYSMINTPIEIRTLAINKKDSSHYAKAGEPVTIVDTIKMNGTDVEKYIAQTGEIINLKYRLEGKVCVVGTDEVLATASKNFITDDFDGHTEELKYVIQDTSALAGETVYVSESLYTVTTQMVDGERKEIRTLVACEDEAVFPDLSDAVKETQRIHFPDIETSLTDEDGDRTVDAAKTITLTDTVTYRGLIKGHTYTVKGTLMDKATGKEALDDEGEPIESEPVTFKAAKSDGTVDITFTFNGVRSNGHTYVAFETLLEEDEELAVHADLEDQDQTVTVPEIEIGTVLVDAETEQHTAYESEMIPLTDTVSYKNLAVGATYQMKGTLYDKNTGKPLSEVEPVVVEFVPESKDGTVGVSFEVPGSAAKDKVLVAFEELSYDGEILKEHEDLTDTDQTVEVIPVEIGTSLIDEGTHTHVANAFRDLKLTDTVSCKGLRPGHEYELKSRLISKKTGKPVLDADGNEVTAVKTFTAEETSENVEVTFEFANRELMGDAAVCFEELYEADVLIGEHEDLEDEEQTVRFPYIGTTLTRNDTSKVFHPTESLSLNDAVALNNLDLQTTYLVKGYLVNQKTGKYLMKDGKETGDKEKAYMESVKFLATKHDARLNVEFELDASEIRFDIVCYEELYAIGEDEDGEETVTLVAEHSDIEDQAQTVRYEDTPKTGDASSTLLWAVLMMAGLAGIALTATIVIRKRYSRR